MDKLLLLLKLNSDELIKLVAGFYAIGTSAYDILQDVTKMHKEHGVMLIGVMMVIKAIPDMVNKIKLVNNEVKMDENAVAKENKS